MLCNSTTTVGQEVGLLFMPTDLSTCPLSLAASMAGGWADVGSECTRKTLNIQGI